MSADRSRRGGRAAGRQGGGRGRSWLGSEIELIMRERERLLHAAGAAAALVARLDIRAMPDEVRRPLQALGATLALLPDETLSDAMRSLWHRARTSTGSH